MQKFPNKVVFITGASSGIGEALAREFHRQGAHLVLVARREERLEALKTSLGPGSQQVLVVKGDVTRDEDMQAAAAAARKAFGRIDVVVANAGFGVTGNVENLTLADYERQFATNTFGVLRTVYATVEDLKASKGYLAIMGSVMGFISLAGVSPYAMSKASVRALADTLHFELVPEGVSVTHIAPGYVRSEIRHVDNEGRWVEKARDPIPLWLQMPADKAARQMVQAIYRRRPEILITFHAKAITFIERHLPWLTHFAKGTLKIKGRKEARALQ